MARDIAKELEGALTAQAPTVPAQTPVSNNRTSYAQTPAQPAVDETQPRDIAAELQSALAEQDLRQQHSQRADGESALDLTTDLITSPVDAYQTMIGNPFANMLGYDDQPLASDVVKNYVRDSEVGFKLEEGTRRTGKELLMIPAAPSALVGLTSAVVDAALTDDTLAEAFFTEEGQALQQAAADGEPAALEKLTADPGAYMKPGMGFTMNMSEWADDVSGVAQRPDGSVPIDEEVYGILGSAMIGAPAGVVTKIATGLTAQFGDKALDVATKIATSKAGKIAGKTAELATPITLPLTPGNVAANAAVGVAINDGMRVAMDEDTAIGHTFEASKDVSPELAGAAAVAGGAALAVAALRRPSKARGIITGNKPFEQQTGVANRSLAQRTEAALVDADAPMIHVMEDVHGKNTEALEATRDLMYTNTRQAGDVKIDQIWREGSAPITGQGVDYSVPGSLIVKQADRLDEPARRVLDEGLIAKNLQDDIKRGRGNASFWTQQQINQKAALLDKNPQLKPIVDAYRTHMKQVLKNATDAGLFSTKEYNDMVSRPYVPHIPLKNTKQTITDALWTGDARFSNQVVSPFTKFRKGDKMDFENPFAAMGIYERSITRQALENHTLQGFLKMFDDGLSKLTREQMREQFPKGLPIRKLRRGETSGETIRVMDGGVAREVVVGDTQLRTSMQFAPHSTAQLMSDFRRLNQMGTTGELNPLFAGTSAMIDAFFSSMHVRRHQVGGVIDAALHATGVRQVPVVGDALSAVARLPDTLMNVGIGTAHGAYDNLVGGIALRMQQNMPELTQMFGEPTAAAMTDAMTRRWHKTMSYQMREAGYAPGMFTEEVGDMQGSTFDRVYRGLFQNNLPGAMYRGTLNTVKDSYRLSFFSQQYTKYRMQGMDQVKARTRAAREAREIGSDPSRAGQSKMMTHATSSIPYANIGVQSLGHMAKIMTDDRMVTAPLTFMSHVAYMGAASAMLYEMGGAEWWYDRTNDRTRARGLPINTKWMSMSDKERTAYTFDPDDVTVIDIGPEMAVFRSVVMAGLEAAGGVFADSDYSAPDVAAYRREIGTSLRALNPIGVPPAVNAVLSPFGMGPIMENRFTEGRSMFPEAQPGAGLMGDQRETGANGGMMTDTMANVLTSLMSGFGRTVADSVEQVDGYTALTGEDVSAALGTIYERRMYNTKQDLPTGMWGSTRSPDRNAPVVQKAYDVSNSVELMKDQVEIDMYGVVGQGDDPISFAEVPMRLGNKVQDAGLREQLMVFSELWSGDPVVDDAFNRMRNFRTQYNGVEARRDMPRKSQVFYMDQLTKGIQDEAATIMDRYTVIESGMKARYPNWSLDAMTQDALKSIKSAPARTSLH